jgi:signal transduction histidine kinase
MPFLKRFSAMQWKLALSCVGVTVLTVVVLEAVAITAVDWFGPWIGNAWARRAGQRQAEHVARSVADALEARSPERLAQALDRSTGLVFQIITEAGTELANERARWSDVAHVVIGARGYVVASNCADRYPAGHVFAEPDLPEAERAVREALAGGGTRSCLVQELNLFIAVVPLTDANGVKMGVLYHRQPVLDVAGLSLRTLWRPLLATTAVLLPCIAALGFVLSSVITRGTMRRLRQASRVPVDADLGSRADDPSDDEIGQLRQQFDAMTEQIQANAEQRVQLDARLAQQAQELAALEERHRLALERQDRVKQHLFELNLATASALNLFESDPEAARAKLLEARQHSRRARIEMQGLLDELRPAGLDEGNLLLPTADDADHVE